MPSCNRLTNVLQNFSDRRWGVSWTDEPGEIADLVPGLALWHRILWVLESYTAEVSE
jgi:hypothetical protein